MEEQNNSVIVPPAKQNNNKPKIIAIVLGLIFLILICLALIVYAISRNTNISGNADITNTPVQTTVPPALTSTALPTTTETTNVIKLSKITGGLTYPSEGIPGLNVCAYNIATKKEFCILTAQSQSTFSIDVNAGDYLVYARDLTGFGNNRAYYTKCDTYADPFIPECNPNAGPESDNGKWNQEGFVCFQDPVCKAAFTPLVIKVGEQATVALKSIQQGWYIPCSYSVDVCNGQDFNPWKDYVN